MNTSRRDFFKWSAAGMAVSMVPGAKASGKKVEMTLEEKYARVPLGMASYTFRKFSLDDTIKMTVRLGLKHIAFKDMHLPLNSTDAQIKEVAAKVKDAGLDLYGCGVVYMRTEADVHQAFNYAKVAGMRVIISAPAHNLLPLVNKKVQEFDLKVSIHNHGPGDEQYPTPESVYEKIKDLDPRIGICMDIGHTMRMGLSPVEAVKTYKDRMNDLHVKDVSAPEAKGVTVEIGRGVINIPLLMKTLIEIGYKGIASFEHEKDAEDPLAGVAESMGYLRGILAAI